MFDRLSIKLKMLLMAVIPVVVIFGISLSSVLEKYEIMHKTEHIKGGAILATEIGALVHEIQKERGLSAGYLASNGARFKEQLEIARQNIALSKKKIENFFSSSHIEHYPDGFVKGLKESLFELEKIELIRLKVNSFSITKEEVIEHFSSINKSFLFAIEQIGGFNSDADIEKMLNAYANFLLAKEYAGIERAYLIFGFEKKSFSEEEYEKFLALVIAQNAYMDNFLRQAFDEDKKYYKETLKGELLKEIDKMRNSAKMLLNEKTSNINPLDWYELSTIRIDLLKKIEDHLAFSIMDRADELNKLAQTEMKFNFVFSLAVLIFLLLFGFFTARGLARRIATFKEELERIVSLKDFSRSLTISGNDEITSIQKATNDTILNANQAIQTTKENLEKLKEKNWIKDGLTELSKEISGDIELTAVCQNGLNFVSRYINSKKSALFLHDKDEKRVDFKVGYAFEKSEKPITSFDIGEGVVGQVAFEKKPVYFFDLYENDAIKINTATTKSSATNIYVIPLVFNNELIAVVEFASGVAFEKTEMEFLEEANTLLASAINTSIKNNEVKELLKITEESKIELNERSLALEEANRYMQEQQTELEEANVQLEEQQQQLKISEIELREKNETLKKSQKELELSSKYKSEFLANMSHELRTPLNSIMLLSSLLSKNKKQNLNEEDIKKANAINRAGEELLRLISDILDLSKVESGNMEIVVDSFLSSDFLNEIKEMFEHMADEKSIYLNIIDDYNGVITTDKNRLSQIARNLLSNSFKFTKEGGVTVRLSKSSDPKRPVELSITDTGIGIPIEKQKLIFEAFKQA
ncbi:MAG: hypothetical protein QG567_2051, partial [Campylobacterota bacterium]|nr:hypothetical protein [Campylobacterota bacterium]